MTVSERLAACEAMIRGPWSGKERHEAANELAAIRAEIEAVAGELRRHVFACTKCGASGYEEKCLGCGYLMVDCGAKSEPLAARLAPGPKEGV